MWTAFGSILPNAKRNARRENMSNKLTKMARELLAIEEDLPFRLKDRYHHTINDFDIRIFEQIWGSTALGFPGMGGQAMTTANTYVLIPINIDSPCFVYFAGRFAYSVDYSQEFMEDVRKESVEAVYRSSKYPMK